MPRAKAPSKRSGETGGERGGRLGWSRSEARGRPGGSELRRVVDVEEDEANSAGGSDDDSRQRAAGNLEVLKVELKQIVARVPEVDYPI